MNKCIKGKSCLHCNTDYCRFKDEVAELKAECERLKDANFILRERTINYSEYKEKQYKQALQEIRGIVNKAYYTEDYMLGERFTELVDAINMTITNIIGAE